MINLVPTNDLKQQALGIFSELDISETSIKDYSARIGLFLDFIGDNGGINYNSFLDYKRYLASRNDYAVSTKNKYLISARVLLKDLNRRGSLPVDTTQNVKTFTQNHKHKRDGLNEKEIGLITQYARNLPSTPSSTRLRAILSLLILQGLRQVEIVRLDVKDLDLVRKVAFIQGKGRDDKEPVSLHPETVRVLKEYLKSNRIASGALFVSLRGKQCRLSTRGLRKLIKRVFTELGIDKVVHGCRHYFTSKLIKNYQGDLLEVSRYTRHRSLEMLQVYNDNIKLEQDLPRFYRTFEDVNFQEIRG